MTSQLLVVLLFVGAAASYLVWQFRRAWVGGKTGCGGGCSCPTKAEPPPQKLIATEELLSRFQQ